jgi:hypothetical protein
MEMTRELLPRVTSGTAEVDHTLAQVSDSSQPKLLTYEGGGL